MWTLTCILVVYRLFNHQSNTPAISKTGATSLAGAADVPGAAFAVCSSGPPLVVGDAVTLARTLLNVAMGAAEVGSGSSVCTALEVEIMSVAEMALVGAASCSSSPAGGVEEGTSTLPGWLDSWADAVTLAATDLIAELADAGAELVVGAAEGNSDGTEIAPPPPQSAVPPSFTTIPTPATGSFRPLSPWNFFTSKTSPSVGNCISAYSRRCGFVYMRKTYCRSSPCSPRAPGALYSSSGADSVSIFVPPAKANLKLDRA